MSIKNINKICLYSSVLVVGGALADNQNTLVSKVTTVPTVTAIVTPEVLVDAYNDLADQINPGFKTVQDDISDVKSAFDKDPSTGAITTLKTTSLPNVIPQNKIENLSNLSSTVTSQGQSITLLQDTMENKLDKDNLSFEKDSNGNVTMKSGTTTLSVAGLNYLKGEKGDTGATGATGPQGPKGDTGSQGPRGYQGYTFTPSVSDAGVISWTNDGGLSNPTAKSIKGPQGAKGDTGAQGPKGDTGAKGDTGSQGPRGYTFTPSVSSAGVISWTNDGSLSNPTAINIKGPQGERGYQGYTFTPSVDSSGNLSWSNNGSLSNPTTVNIKGPQGAKGDTGATGATGPQGAKGDTGSQGPRGYQGYTFTPSVDSSGNLSWTNDGGLTNPTTRNITGPQGATGSQGPKGDKGDKGDTGATGPQGPQGPAGVVDSATLATLATISYVQNYDIPATQIKGSDTAFSVNKTTGAITGVLSSAVSGLDGVMSAVNNSSTGLAATYNMASSTSALVGDCSRGRCPANSLMSALIQAGIISVSTSGNTMTITGIPPSCSCSGGGTSEPKEEKS